MSVTIINGRLIDKELYVALEQLYYSAHWSSDRLTEQEEIELWKAIKELCEFTAPSPKPIK